MTSKQITEDHPIKKSIINDGKNLNREKLYENVMDITKDLLNNLYGSKSKFINTKHIHVLEKYFIRFNRVCGSIMDVDALAIDMNIKINTSDPNEIAVELYEYLYYLSLHPKEAKELSPDLV